MLHSVELAHHVHELVDADEVVLLLAGGLHTRCGVKAGNATTRLKEKKLRTIIYVQYAD